MSKNFIRDLNILDGKITFNDFCIDETIPFEEQKDAYKEDIVQIRFGPRFVLDVGWYPEMNFHGSFAVQAIQDLDWMNPVFKLTCRTLSELKEAIEKTVLLIDQMRNVKDLPYRDVEYEEWD